MNEERKNLGLVLSPILEEIEIALFEHQLKAEDILVFDKVGFRAATKIFMDVMLSKMWQLQVKEDMEQQDKENMAFRLGEEIRALIKTYTNIDTHQLYKN